MTVTVAGTPTVAGATGPVNTITINKPTGVADGDVLVAVLRSSSSGATAEFSLTGWTKAAPTTFTASDAASRLHGIYYKVIPSAASEIATSYTFTFVGTTGRTTGQIFIARGVDNANPVQVASSAYDAASVTNGGQMAAITATGAGWLLVAGGNEVVSPNADTATTPSGFTFIALSESTSGTAATRSTTSTFFEQIAGAGSTGTVNVVWVSASGVSVDGVIFNASTGFSVSASGVTSASATASSSVTANGSASGTTTTSGTSAATRTANGSATASTTTTGTATGSVTKFAAASGITTGTAAANAGVTKNATATAATTVTGSAGVAVSVTATATTTGAGSATATVTLTVSATGATTVTAAATATGGSVPAHVVYRGSSSTPWVGVSRPSGFTGSSRAAESGTSHPSQFTGASSTPTGGSSHE